MENVKISIIMPSLNVADYISKSIESAVNQTLKEIEIICIDAGSTDGTLEIIKSFAEKDNRVRLVNSSIKSYGHQMNLGISQAKGKYIGIIETDDFVKPEMYEELYQVAEEQQLDFVKADFYRFIIEQGGIKKKYNKLGADIYYNRVINPVEELEIFRLIMNTWSGIYKRNFLEVNDIKHNETPGAAYQDNGFWFQTFCCAKRGYFINKPYYMNRRDNPNSSVFNLNWLPRMVVEYRFIYEWLKDRKLLRIFRGPFAVMKYRNLIAGFDMAPYSKKLEYADIFAREMASHIDNGEYEKGYFRSNEWEWLELLLNNTEEFFEKRSHLKETQLANKIKSIEKELNSTKKELKKTKEKLKSAYTIETNLKNSISFRIGRAITWIPRKVRSGVLCYKQHGVAYTIKKLVWNITHLK